LQFGVRFIPVPILQFADPEAKNGDCSMKTFLIRKITQDLFFRPTGEKVKDLIKPFHLPWLRGLVHEQFTRSLVPRIQTGFVPSCELSFAQVLATK